MVTIGEFFPDKHYGNPVGSAVTGNHWRVQTSGLDDPEFRVL
jgi:hypothetical protein